MVFREEYLIRSLIVNHSKEKRREEEEKRREEKRREEKRREEEEKMNWERTLNSIPNSSRLSLQKNGCPMEVVNWMSKSLYFLAVSVLPTVSLQVAQTHVFVQDGRLHAKVVNVGGAEFERKILVLQATGVTLFLRGSEIESVQHVHGMLFGHGLQVVAKLLSIHELLKRPFDAPGIGKLLWHRSS